MTDGFTRTLGGLVPPQRHRPSAKTYLIYADCRDALKQLPDNHVHLLLTDPPYFIDGLDNKWRKGKSGTTKGTGSVGGLPVGMKFDPAQGKALQEFIFNVAQELLRVLLPGGFFLSFSQPRLVHRMASGIEDAGFEIRDLYAWHFTQRAQFKAFSMDHFVDKMDIPLSSKSEIKRKLNGRKTPQLRPQFEAIILAQKPRKGTFVNNWLMYETGLVDTSIRLDNMSPSTVMKVEKPSGDERCHSHITPKPIDLLTHLIRLFSVKGQTVLDPFMGSGSTAIAAKRADRSCIGIDIEQEYIEVAKRRLGL